MRSLGYLFWLLCLFWTSHQSELSDLMSMTSEFFEEFYDTEISKLDSDIIESMLRRNYDLNDAVSHKVSRRSLDYDEPLLRDKQGVQFLSNIEDVVKIPAKFPDDITIHSSHNLLFIISLEANGTEPQSQLSNDMVLYQYSFIQGIKELGRVPVLGGKKIAVWSFQNVTYLMSAEHDASHTPDTFEGSVLYKMAEQNGKISLEKIQILNVIQPSDLKFWEHQDQLYLMIGCGTGNDTLRTGTLVYRWVGHHFDRIQHIPSKQIVSLTPFSIGSFMYLAVANFQDEHGKTDVESEIYQFHLQDMKFRPFQKIKTHGARHFAYFKFQDGTSKKSEHFLVVANSLGRNSAGNLTSSTESVVYKFVKDVFVPFQSFKLHGASQWLPIQGPDNEFLLLVSHSYGVFGYQYDGWRFTQVSLKFDQTSFGENIRSIRSFQYFGEIYLIIADKNSPGNNINLWKLSFRNRNNLEKRYKEIEDWCQQTDSELIDENFDRFLKEFDSQIDPLYEETKIKAENLKQGDFTTETRDELERVSEEAENVEKMLEEAEEKIESMKTDSEYPIVIGSKELPHLEVECASQNCCSFKNLKVLKMNGENFEEFLASVVSLDHDIHQSVMEFEEVVVENDLPSSTVNGHPSETLISVTYDTYLNGQLVVNGTVFINDRLHVEGTFDEVTPDWKHILLTREDQQFQDKLSVDTLKVDNLKVSGIINGVPVENLFQEPEMNLKNNFDELNVNNLFVGGLVGGYNLSEAFENTLRKSGTQEIESDLTLDTLEAEEVIIDADEISNISLSDLFRENLCQLELDASVDQNTLEAEPLAFRHNEDKIQPEEELIIIVEGLLTAEDITDGTNLTSLLDIIQNSYKLNEPVVDSVFEFSDVIVNNLFVDTVNESPVSSWLLKNSDKAEHVTGKKRFFKDIYIREKVSVEIIDDVNWVQLEEEVLTLDGDQDILADLTFDTISCHKLVTNSTNFDFKPNALGRVEIRQSVQADLLEVGNLVVSGDIDGVSWTNLVEDSVFNRSQTISGEKRLEGSVRVENLNLTGRLNGLLFEEFLALNSQEIGKFILDRDITLENPLNVDELYFEGLLDSIFTPNFHDEWLLQDETQTVTGPVIFENVTLKSGASLVNETINNVNLRRLFTRSLKINEDTKIRRLFAIDKVIAERIDLGGTLNGALFSESVLRSRGDQTVQEVSGEWFLNQDLIVDGSLKVKGLVSGLNVTHMCAMNVSDKLNLIVGGSVRMKREPEVRMRMNGIDLSKKVGEIWMKDDNVTLKGTQLRFENVELGEKLTLQGSLNNVSLTQLSNNYLSKTINRVVPEDFEFDDLVIQKWCRIHWLVVDGLVNGFNFSHFAKNVLLQDETQVIEEKLRFEIFEASNLRVEGTVNEFNLSSDLLRLDVDDAIVEGEKTFQAINVENLTLASGRHLQGVDIEEWSKKAVGNTGNDIVITGNLTLSNAEFYEPVVVEGMVNGIRFDLQHLLTTTGNQVLTGVKLFDEFSHLNQSIKMKYLEVNGLVNGIDLEELMKGQAYSDQNLIFQTSKKLTKGLSAESIEVDGLFQKINISQICDYALHPVDSSFQVEEFDNLANQTQMLIEVVKGRAFFVDYYELIQTLKPNIKAVVPALDDGGNYLLAVFTPDVMRFMEWNRFSETFSETDEELVLTDDITFVTSETSANKSMLFIESRHSAKIMQGKILKEIESIETSCAASFELPALNKSCIFVGEKKNNSRIMCNGFLASDLQTYQTLESEGSVQVSVLTIDDEVFIAVINQEEVFDKPENTLSIYRFDSKLQHFYLSHTLAEVNPVALSSISYKKNHFLVSAGGHLPESVHNSVLSIFTFNRHQKVFVRTQSILVDTPVDVHLALLPSSQLALYVLTSNPTKPFVVFLHKGVSGFVEETSGLSLYPGSNLYSFTDYQNQHFVVISGFGRGQILKAGFKGDKN